MRELREAISLGRKVFDPLTNMVGGNRSDEAYELEADDEGPDQGVIS
jgi:hypothetical protein